MYLYELVSNKQEEVDAAAEKLCVLQAELAALKAAENELDTFHMLERARERTLNPQKSRW